MPLDLKNPGPRHGSLERRLLLFAKLPEPGRSKTRLISSFGPDGAAFLYEAFLDDTVALCRRVKGVLLELWASGDVEAHGYMTRRYPDLPVRLQGAGDLGDRLAEAFETAFAEGADYAAVVGSDHPTLPAAYLERAFAALVAAHAVIGPSSDGGYYLLGLRRYAWPAAAGLFDDVPWSTPRVLQVTREAARRLGLCHVELPEWYDVDDPADLARLRADAAPDSRSRRALELLSTAASG